MERVMYKRIFIISQLIFFCCSFNLISEERIRVAVMSFETGDNDATGEIFQIYFLPNWFPQTGLMF